jgi:GGDEF domain-containing protein
MSVVASFIPKLMNLALAPLVPLSVILEGPDEALLATGATAGDGGSNTLAVAAVTLAFGLAAMIVLYFRSRGRVVAMAPITGGADAAPREQVILPANFQAPAPFGRGLPPQLAMPCAPDRWIEVAAEVSCRHDRRVGVIVARIGAFEDLQFRLGAEHARQTLEILTNEMRSVLRPSDLVAVRDGGDIVCCTPFVMVKDEIRSIAGRLRRKIDQVGHRAGIDFGASVGSAIYPIDGYSGEELIANAVVNAENPDQPPLDLPALAARNPYMLVPPLKARLAPTSVKRRAKAKVASPRKRRQGAAEAALAGDALG